MGRIIKAIYDRIYKFLTRRPRCSTHLVTVNFSDGRSLELPQMENSPLYNSWDIRAVIPCKSIVLAVGEDKLLLLPASRLGITAHGDIQLMDISCDSISYSWQQHSGVQ